MVPLVPPLCCLALPVAAGITAVSSGFPVYWAVSESAATGISPRHGGGEEEGAGGLHWAAGFRGRDKQGFYYFPLPSHDGFFWRLVQHWVTQCDVAFCSVQCNFVGLYLCLGNWFWRLCQGHLSRGKTRRKKTKRRSAFLGKLPQLPNGSLQIHSPIGQSVGKIKMCNLRLLE